MLFQKKSVDWMVVGLGNPGLPYERSRHNTGFRAIDLLCSKEQCRADRVRMKALTGFCTLAGHRVLLVKPVTYMNLSGQAVRPLADYYKIPSEHILVIFDDISLPVGKLRVRPGGSAGGHNGIKSLIAELGTQEFPRIKIGVGAKPHPDYDLADWVLSSFTPQEEKRLAPALAYAVDAVTSIMDHGVSQTMNSFNGL